ncbi:MAG: class I SAM-dependent methyltransferase [Phyllobacteriaceae bacterium]|nr:class I SAM-dependent methyltransferase [Phyllobacteriaceae bacterium]
MDRSAKTLLVPFATGDVAPPAAESDWLFLNAVDLGAAGDLFEQVRLCCVQPSRPRFLALERAGHEVWPNAPVDEPFDGALVLLGKHRRLNEAMIAKANDAVRPGGLVIIAGDKAVGAASARKWAGGQVALGGSLAKHHGIAFWFPATEGAFANVALAQTEPAPGFAAAPGMFSPDKVDAGSALLAENIDGRIAGAVADFGAGWGYLSGAVLAQAKPASLDLIEAYRPALDQALATLSSLRGEVPVTGHWLDVTTEPMPGPFDWVVMNPPFHTGRASEPDLGRAFIAAAARALKPSGRLLMVANRRLPYEKTLRDRFASFEERAVRDGFKLVEASRPRRSKGQDAAASAWG